MKMKAWWLAALLGLSAGAAHAQWSVHAQVERFHWNEESGSPEVNESGGRFGLGLGYEDKRTYGLRGRYRGTFYAGSIRYKGSEIATGNAAQTTTDYVGLVNELHLLYRPKSDSFLQLIAGIGLDYWQRTLPATSQREDWNVVFTRLGLETGTWKERGFSAGGGVKYPLRTHENAHWEDIGFDQNPQVEPGRELSLWAELGYRFTNWKLTGYYDSYRFAQSPNVHLTSGGLGFVGWQPRSAQDQLGLRLQYYF